MTAQANTEPFFLRIVKGAPGASYEVSTQEATRIGRDDDCDIVLNDPLCSRVHATIEYDEEEGTWWLRDQQSRNGTYVNGSKVHESQLGAGAEVRIGSIEFCFDREPGTEVTETIRMDWTVEAGTVFDEDEPRQLKLLNDLSMQLLSCDDPDDVVAVCLELLLRNTESDVVGFLWRNDAGELRPKAMLPEQAEGVKLSNMLTEVVCKKRRAVWVEGQTAESNRGSLAHYSDAICVPLLHDDSVLGAIHLYIRAGHFQDEHFKLGVAVAKVMVLALARARRQATLEVEHERLVNKSASFDELIGKSQPMKLLQDKIRKVAKATGCVLVRGESGAGKELVARAIHRAGSRADRPMLSVNCAAIPRDLMESQLFGHRKGAFTGAEQDHVGWFQQADSGTLFLDEVGEMTLEGQAKLLRILEGHPFLPVGAADEVTADVRVIAATNRDLGEFVREGKFREDLFYRLSVFELMIPPLRDRGEDLRLLIDFFLEHFRTQHGRPQLELAPKAREQMLAYGWPGNVRQLRNVIDSAVVMADGSRILVDDLGLREAVSIEQESLNIEYWERKLIKEALRRTANHVPEAAKLLGMGRATLYRKVEEYGIDR